MKIKTESWIYKKYKYICDNCETKMVLVDNNNYYKCEKCGLTRAK